ncbi:MAG: hypothetical protein SV686_04005, partial [Thermodesulfobacteriota bacterium]|nr:hypothetical protein [Thermodesulfobacteriota bacterium]
TIKIGRRQHSLGLIWLCDQSITKNTTLFMQYDSRRWKIKYPTNKFEIRRKNAKIKANRISDL